jgi:hypothetical protein
LNSLDDHVAWVDPHKYGLDREGINPNDYFITSGDAVEKARILDKDLWNLAGSLRREVFTIIAKENNCDHIRAQELFRQGVKPRKPAKLADYEAAAWKAAGQCRKLLNNLRLAKGINTFLETEWNNHQLLCIPKNPRK